MIENIPVLGANTNFRNFREFNDLLLYVRDFQARHKMNPNHQFGSVRGIMNQFMAFDLEVPQRKKDEVMIYYMEENPKTIDEEIKLNVVWVNNKTRKILAGPPEWYNEQKKDYWLSEN